MIKSFFTKIDWEEEEKRGDIRILARRYELLGESPKNSIRNITFLIVINIVLMLSITLPLLFLILLILTRFIEISEDKIMTISSITVFLTIIFTVYSVIKMCYIKMTDLLDKRMLSERVELVERNDDI